MRKLAALLLLLIVGCSRSPSLDCTSEQTFAASKKVMLDAMTPEESKAVLNGISMVSQTESLKAVGAGKVLPEHELAKQFNGMTGKEIIAKTDELRRDAKSKRR